MCACLCVCVCACMCMYICIHACMYLYACEYRECTQTKLVFKHGSLPKFEGAMNCGNYIFKKFKKMSQYLWPGENDWIILNKCRENQIYTFLSFSFHPPDILCQAIYLWLTITSQVQGNNKVHFLLTMTNKKVLTVTRHHQDPVIHCISKT